MSGLTQCTHSPHWGENSVTTWSPSEQQRDALAAALDDAGALVAEHRRRVAGGIDPRGGVHVGVTDPAGDQPHEHLARAGLGQLDLLHDERLGELLEHGRADLHRAALASERSSPASVWLVAAVIRTSVSSPGAARPVKLTTLLWRVRPRSRSGSVREVPSTSTSQRAPDEALGAGSRFALHELDQALHPRRP